MGTLFVSILLWKNIHELYEMILYLIRHMNSSLSFVIFVCGGTCSITGADPGEGGGGGGGLDSQTS